MMLQQVIFWGNSFSEKENHVQLISLYASLRTAFIDILFTPDPSVFETNFTDCLIVGDCSESIRFAKLHQIAFLLYHPLCSQPEPLFSNIPYVAEDLSALEYSYLLCIYQRFHNLPLTIAIGRHVSLREMTLADMKQLYSIYQEADISSYLKPLADLATELDKHQAYIEQVYPFYDYGLWGIYLNQNGELIGRCGIEQKSFHSTSGTECSFFELSYLLAKKFHGRGYALEAASLAVEYAFYELDVTELKAFIAKQNLPSLRLAHRLGMLAETSVCYHNHECWQMSLSLPI